MRSRLGMKFLILVAVLILLQIPLYMIKGQVNERNHTRQKVVSEISRSWGAVQNIVGPILVVPYTTVKQSQIWDTNLEKYRTQETTEHHKRILAPEISKVDATVDVTERKRSIYSAPVYNAKLRMHGQFDLSVLDDIEGTIGTPEFIVLMSDLSGVLSIPVMNVKGDSLTFTEGGFQKLKGIKAHLTDWAEQQPYDFQLDLKGSRQLLVYPLARNNEVSITSNWLHPSFNGAFLPENHQIAEDGFFARWRTTSLSSNANQLLDQCAQNSCTGLMQSSYGVTFFEPVNNYTQSDRAAKYAILLIVTTFAIFFVLEAMKSAAVHPVQYLLVGLSLTVFNLLLVAMTEHLSFLASYLISSIACLGLLGAYAQHILKRRSWLLGFMCVLTLIYTFMYFILLSEDFAFLMGSGLLFLILASVMITTRKVNWYELMSTPNKTRATSDSADVSV